MISDRTATIIIGVVTTIWAVNFAVGMFQLNGYQSSESINGIFMATVGAMLLAKRGKEDAK